MEAVLVYVQGSSGTFEFLNLAIVFVFFRRRLIHFERIHITTQKEIQMAEVQKKAKAPAKPRKAAATKAPLTNLTQMQLPHDQVAQLAHRYWAERGQQHGHHVEDWFRAEQELRGKAS
jgi:hypothetical protein